MNLLQLKILANVITGKGKYYTTLTCFPKLWRFRKINNSGAQQRVSPLAEPPGQEESSACAPQSYPRVIASICLFGRGAITELERLEAITQKQHLALAPDTRASTHPAEEDKRHEAPCYVGVLADMGRGAWTIAARLWWLQSSWVDVSHPAVEGRRLLFKERKKKKLYLSRLRAEIKNSYNL